MSECFLAYEHDISCKCDNCDWEGLSQDTVIIHDIQERIDPGCITPVGECPECGALAYYRDETAPNHTVQKMLWDLRNQMVRLRSELEARLSPHH